LLSEITIYHLEGILIPFQVLMSAYTSIRGMVLVAKSDLLALHC